MLWIIVLPREETIDCDYILVCESGSGFREVRESFPFHAPTSEEAVERAKKIVLERQILTRGHSFPIVKGTLYRGFLEINGRDLVKTTHKSG